MMDNQPVRKPDCTPPFLQSTSCVQGTSNPSAVDNSMPLKPCRSWQTAANTAVTHRLIHPVTTWLLPPSILWYSSTSVLVHAHVPCEGVRESHGNYHDDHTSLSTPMSTTCHRVPHTECMLIYTAQCGLRPASPTAAAHCSRHAPARRPSSAAPSPTSCSPPAACPIGQASSSPAAECLLYGMAAPHQLH